LNGGCGESDAASENISLHRLFDVSRVDTGALVMRGR